MTAGGKTKNAAGFPAVFPNDPKGRKGEKEMGIINFVGPRVQRRENVGGSLNSWAPSSAFASGHRFLSL